MNFKTLLISCVCLFISSNLLAQEIDVLHKRNGEVMQVNVKEITPRTVTYKKINNPDGPTYTMNRADIAKIVYANGTEDIWAEAREIRTKKKVEYGNNIISLIPMSLTSGIGVGLSYERAFGEENILSFYMPVTIAFGTVDPVTGPTTNNSQGPTYYIMPGLKFYPTGGKGKVRYSVGPNLAYVTGQRYVDDLIYDDFGNIVGQDIGWRQQSALGIMVTNGLNINPTGHLHLGLELGLGFTYFNKVNGRDTGTEGLAQFGFKIGYRF